jgi:hypothetical protein
MGLQGMSSTNVEKHPLGFPVRFSSRKKCHGTWRIKQTNNRGIREISPYKGKKCKHEGKQQV